MNGTAALLILLFTSRPAQAYTICGSLGVTGLVVFGLVDGTTHLGVCEYSSAGSGSWTLTEVPACDTVVTSMGRVDMWDDGPVGANTTIAPVVRSSGIDCGGGKVLLPFADYFDFGLIFQGKSGTDKIYGTPNDDILKSNLNTVTALPKDNNADYEVLCGYEGLDELTSDQSTPIGVCLNGGPGGAPTGRTECTVNSAKRIDAVYGCNTVTNNPGLSVDCDDCACGDGPDDSFFPPIP